MKDSPPPTFDDRRRDGPTHVLYEGENRPRLVLRAALLRVVSGKSAGAEAAIALQRVRVGTADDNDLVIDDDGVSRHHVEIQIRDQGYLFRDLGSTNGTFFRGARIHEALVGPGAEVRVGSTVLRIDRGKEQSSLIKGKSAFGKLIGGAKAMQEVYGLLAAVAPTDSTVLLLGETGTGKELVAEEIHRQSPRRNYGFTVIDCGAIPESLIESELFGHQKGAFTGASEDRVGAFEKASGGTIFLDEIGELPLEMQTRLLRVLDKRTVRRVGGQEHRPVDLRVIAATHKDLPRRVDEGLFRQDLFYRLSVVQIRLPALRERTADIPLLARHFLWKCGCADPDQVLRPEVLQTLATRQWPGNIRELRNVIERAMVLADGSHDAFASPPAAKVAPAPSAEKSALQSGGWLARSLPDGYLDQPYKAAKQLLLHQFETLFLERLVKLHGQNISRIAADAEVDRHLVRLLLRKHGMLPPKKKDE